ncbi:SAM-dependent methyltransferase [Aquabacter sp. CN5-332]|uniref:SAM-dependent methyltransferase n=1 Tax=Aquabacter sp. CN5-332 TaxID=3156608 RepID=UPI0032B3A9C9
MSGFSAEWLALREPADARARNAALAEAAVHQLAGHDPLRIVDLGAGTGANLRASAPYFGPHQHWHLLDYEPALLAQARRALAAWADGCETQDDALLLTKDSRRITVDFTVADLARSLAEIGRPRPHLVTASAFFDLVSAPFIDAFAAEVAHLNAAFLTVLTCNGRDMWAPPHAGDAAIAAAFAADQGKDKGFGPALGNAASDHLERAFRSHDYAVERADSPWRLGPEDGGLVRALAEGTAAAAVETGRIAATEAAAWAEARRSASCEIGHTDLLAWR